MDYIPTIGVVMRLSRLIAPILLLIGSIPSTYADVICTGRVVGLLTEKDGNVMVYATFRNDWLLVCNIRTPLGRGAA
jgi:hypothetical protein